MTITKNLGGDRLGSGNKMNISMHNYERSTHDLSRVWRSSMSCGTLVPFLVEPTLPGDTFDIDLNTMVRTMPTLAPLFGSFKIQLDVFSVPIRLYNAQLHMNKLGVGLHMSDIKLPMAKLASKGTPTPDRFNQSCLMAYLGVRGAPQIYNSTGTPQTNASFLKNALPLLSYWTIYKDYYANKQEKKGYLISNADIYTWQVNSLFYYVGTTPTGIPFSQTTGELDAPLTEQFTYLQVGYLGTLDPQDLAIDVHFPDNEEGYHQYYNMTELFTLEQLNTTTFKATPKVAFNTGYEIYAINPIKSTSSTNQVILKSFQLENIDDVHLQILQHSTATPFELNELSPLPYQACTGTVYPTVLQTNYKSQNGLGIKTYQSDVFNNWLDTEWIDGENGINSITSIDTSAGSFSIDTLNLSKKVYDMLNRVAVSGGSYQDWQTAIWGEESFRMPESAIYCGGLSTELIFEEVVSTADATADTKAVPLGSLAGRGTQSNSKKGGNVVIKTNEPSLIMGLVSITPRIDYSQGSKWWTRLKTMDDFHKPALDGIGFQELITESMAHWDCKYINDTKTYLYKSAGKQPAWIDYMTSYNEVFGHFAESDGEDALMQVVLNRQYEYDENTKSIKDLTTYVDPTKYNYAFATTDLTAQNFWVQIAVGVTARRKMSAKIIPNL